MGSHSCTSSTTIYTACCLLALFIYFVVLALTRKNTNAAAILMFLHRLTQVLTEYFRTLEEESIRDNFVVVYELLDEMMDFGYAQTTETKILQEYIFGISEEKVTT